MPFTGLGPQTLPFFKALGFHQTKAWFEENRAIYETQVKAPLGDLVEDLSVPALRQAILAHAGVDGIAGIRVPRENGRRQRQGVAGRSLRAVRP